MSHLAIYKGHFRPHLPLEIDNAALGIFAVGLCCAIAALFLHYYGVALMCALTGFIVFRALSR